MKKTQRTLIAFLAVVLAAFVARAWEFNTHLDTGGQESPVWYDIGTNHTDDALGKITFDELSGGDLNQVSASFAITINGDDYSTEWYRDPQGSPLHVFLNVPWEGGQNLNYIDAHLYDDGGTNGQVIYEFITPYIG